MSGCSGCNTFVASVSHHGWLTGRVIVSAIVMKTSFRAWIAFLMMGFLLVAGTATAAEYYVVVGAFSKESNARRFTGSVRQLFREATYSFNKNRRLYYVHVLRTTRRDEARSWSFYLRREKGFKDAWVLTDAEVDSGNDVAESHGQPRFESTHHLATYPDAGVGSAPPRAEAESGSGRPSAMDELGASWKLSGDIAYLNNVGETPTSAMKASGFVRLFRFVVENAKGERVPSEVMLVNFEKIKKIAGFQPGQNVAIKGTKPEQMVAFVCDVLGYIQETRMYNLDHLSRGKDITRGDDGVWEVSFKLKKMSVNDISVMNKTFFYKEAAILEESSRKELDELVTLMKRHPFYKIILHSHCNPGVNRLLKFPSTDTNYFDPGNIIEKQGSDKLLTRKRGEVVRNYLVENGIDKKRIGLVAWGSMEPVVTNNSEDAHINDRIELELTAE